MSLDVCLYIDVDTGGNELRRMYLFEANITHNLGEMAKEAGIYKQLWRPDEIEAKQAKDIIKDVESGLKLMKSDRPRFEKFNPQHGWGSYGNFVLWVEEYLEACKADPESFIYVSR